jgi:hypothetical protein
MREKEVELANLREKKQVIQERIQHLSKSNSSSKKIPELEKELALLNTSSKETEAHEYKRFIMKEAFYLRFNALQEYAEKTAIIAGYGKYIVDLLDAQNHASSNCDMILQDALLTVNGWKPKDERVTLTEEDVLFQHEDEDEDDALLLNNSEMLIKKKEQPHQPPTDSTDASSQGKVAAATSGSSSSPAVKASTAVTSSSCNTTTDNTTKANVHSDPNNTTTTDYYHRLYQDKKLKQKKQSIQHHRSYADFQNQFDIPSYDQEKREYFAEPPPPAYSNPSNIHIKDNKK